MLSRAVDEIAEAAAAGRQEQVVTLLERMVPEYRRAGNGTERAVANK